MLKFNLSKRITIEFTKDYGEYKKGTKAVCGLVLASEWVKAKAAKLTEESKAYVTEAGLEKMFGVATKNESKEEDESDTEK